MANHVAVTICGEEYTLVAEESASYMQRVGAYVNDKMAAVNITDELFKAQAEADQLRRQIKEYLDQASKAQSEVSELKREVFRLQQKLDAQNKSRG